MKTNFLIALFLLTSLYGLAQITYVPDDNFERALIAKGIDELPLDDYVQTSKIKDLNYLDVSSHNIKDLTGIEDFTSLTILYCANNDLTNINVTKNIHLKDLQCNRNELTSLDVSKNTKLEILICNENKLSSLDISKQPNLRSLEVSFNVITSLDIMLNPALETLHCRNNLLSQIDISSNAELVSLICSSNKLNNLDISLNKSLNFLECSDNLLTSLDLSKNSLLNWLHVNDNQLTFLDLRNEKNSEIQGFNSFNNPNLTCIYVDDPAYSSLNWTDVDDPSSFKLSPAECYDAICDQPEVAVFDDVDRCDTYILATIDKGNYYTESNGNGVLLQPEDHIYTSQTVYIYSVDPSNPECTNESSFKITIHEVPNLDEFQDISVCDGFTLAELSAGNYFTDSDGQGTSMDSGELITRSQTVYIYATSPNNMDCYAETSFDIQINESIDFELNVTHLEIDHQDLQINIFNPSIQFEFAIDDNSNYQNSPMFFNLSEGDHQLFVRDEDGCVEKSLSFTIYKDLYIPKFFTPNNDGENDYWAITDPDNFVKDISVFDRFGRVISHFLPNSQGWNGYYNGNPALSADYWYLLRLNSGDEIKGHFSLKR